VVILEIFINTSFSPTLMRIPAFGNTVKGYLEFTGYLGDSYGLRPRKLSIEAAVSLINSDECLFFPPKPRKRLPNKGVSYRALLILNGNQDDDLKVSIAGQGDSHNLNFSDENALAIGSSTQNGGLQLRVLGALGYLSELNFGAGFARRLWATSKKVRDPSGTSLDLHIKTLGANTVQTIEIYTPQSFVHYFPPKA
jgi:hypothetical protein